MNQENFDMSFSGVDTGKMPAVDMLQRGVIIFNGDAIHTRAPRGFLKYTYTQGKSFSAPFSWDVPDQVINIPTVNI